MKLFFPSILLCSLSLLEYKLPKRCILMSHDLLIIPKLSPKQAREKRVYNGFNIAW